MQSIQATVYSKARSDSDEIEKNSSSDPNLTVSTRTRVEATGFSWISAHWISPVSPRPPIVARKRSAFSSLRADAARTVRTQELEPEHVLAKRAADVMVLAMDVIRNRAADSHELRSRRDAEKPSARHGHLQNLREQHAAFAREPPRRPVETHESIDSPRVNQQSAVVEAAVAIAAPVPERQPRNVTRDLTQAPRAMMQLHDLVIRPWVPAPRLVDRADHSGGSRKGRKGVATVMPAASAPALSAGSAHAVTLRSRRRGSRHLQSLAAGSPDP